jgi:hypothetical protein
MADVLVLLTVAAFFALCVAFVWGCDRIIGRDDESTLATTPADEAEEIAASDPTVTAARVR